jgi:hypothetical protein
LLAFNISFPPTLTAVYFVILVEIAWVALGISILCVVIIHFARVMGISIFAGLNYRYVALHTTESNTPANAIPHHP